MKKNLLLFIFIGITLSCSTNNDDNLPDNNNGCNKPSAFSVNSITANSAILDWANNSSSQLFNVEYGPRGFTLGTGTTISSNVSYKEITGLSSTAEYDFYARANCGGNDFSEWGGPHSFITN